MVATQGHGTPGIDHGPYQLHHPQTIRSAVDVIAHKDHLPLRVLISAGSPFVAELAQQGFQAVGMAVDVADEVGGWICSLVNGKITTPASNKSF